MHFQFTFQPQTRAVPQQSSISVQKTAHHFVFSYSIPPLTLGLGPGTILYPFGSLTRWSSVLSFRDPNHQLIHPVRRLPRNHPSWIFHRWMALPSSPQGFLLPRQIHSLLVFTRSHQHHKVLPIHTTLYGPNHCPRGPSPQIPFHLSDNAPDQIPDTPVPAQMLCVTKSVFEEPPPGEEGEALRKICCHMTPLHGTNVLNRRAAPQIQKPSPCIGGQGVVALSSGTRSRACGWWKDPRHWSLISLLLDPETVVRRAIKCP